MSVEARRTDDAFDVDLVFTKVDLEDVVAHDNDLVVISAHGGPTMPSTSTLRTLSPMTTI